MSKVQLNPKILEYLEKKTNLKQSTIRQTISKLKRNYPSCTLNAVAQIYATQTGFSVMQKLSQEDKVTLPHSEVVSPKIKIEKKSIKKKEKIINIISYETNDYFKKGHIKEINRAYTHRCYTSVYAMARKIIENLVREILSIKYPPTSKANRELYFNTSRKRIKDFGVILKNLYNKKNDFGIEKSKIIGRLYQKAMYFKDDSNDKVHSWYHLVENKKEIDDVGIQSIIELIKKLEN